MQTANTYQRRIPATYPPSFHVAAWMLIATLLGVWFFQWLRELRAVQQAQNNRDAEREYLEAAKRR